MMKRIAVVALVVLSATACTRRVVVESEPNRFEAGAQSMIDMTGTYDYVVELGGQQAVGPMTVTRDAEGAYAIRMTSNMGAVSVHNVRREGNTLTMDARTPGGDGAVELTWQSADEVTGMLFLDEVYNMRATRRP